MFKSKTAPAVSYTLTCTDGVKIGATSATATPFYMVVPVGEYKFKADIYDNATIPANMCWLIPSAAKTFTAGKCLNMPAKEVTVVYEGTDNDHAWVNLGLSVVWATTNVGVTTPEGIGTKYYLTEIPSWGDNWRLPTADEWQELLDHTTNERIAPQDLPDDIDNPNSYGWKYINKSNSEKYIFLPFTDIAWGEGECEYGDYWSSTDDGDGGKLYYRSASKHDTDRNVNKATDWTKSADLNARLVCDVWN
ncbi:MAG: hypothetical protein KBS42_02960 [Bacteroidales bacterium]|nr:hypothetical protein [Candidatus Colicola coprequi]